MQLFRIKRSLYLIMVNSALSFSYFLIGVTFRMTTVKLLLAD
jgi:hypothetical protein